MIKKNKNIVIAALARDCGYKLNNLIPLIEELRNNFIWSEVIVVENDSKDNTKEILKKWCENSNEVNIISQDFGILTIPTLPVDGINPLVSFHRIEKMSAYRNIYLNYINEIQHDIDNVIIIDLDVQSFSVEGVLEGVSLCSDKCGAIFANGITIRSFFGKVYSKLFYDVFAVSEYPLRPKLSFTDKTLMKTLKNVRRNLKKVKIYPVISAFGGLAIYNYKAISELKYSAVPNDENKNEAICEHIPFNEKIISLGYENFISKKMELIYGKHSFGSILRYYLNERFFNILFKISQVVNLKKNIF